MEKIPGYLKTRATPSFLFWYSFAFFSRTSRSSWPQKKHIGRRRNVACRAQSTPPAIFRMFWLCIKINVIII